MAARSLNRYGDCRESWSEVSGERQIVESHDGKVARHVKPTTLCLQQDSKREDVVATYKRVGKAVAVKQLAQSLATRLDGVGFLHNSIAEGSQALVGQRVCEALISAAGPVVFSREAADHTDPGMSE
jgi:hypothetical protein